MGTNKKTAGTKETPVIKLKPIEELEGFDSSDANAFVCDMETGVCGPINKKKETK